jgi:pyruvate oxidase
MIDVGNININFARLSHLQPSNKWATSGKHSTMGFAVPAALAAKLEYPDSTVYSLSGDGGLPCSPRRFLPRSNTAPR